jgi:beta-mannosidase
VDATGLPKATWYVMRRAMSPVAVVVTDEGLNGLSAHLSNDRASGFEGVLRVELFTTATVCAETVDAPVRVAARDGQEVALAGLFDGFRDLSYAHRFGPPAFEVVAVSLLGPDGNRVSQATFVSDGPVRPVETDLGLTAVARPEADGDWDLTVHTERFAQWVAVETPGFRPGDSWFHLLPGRPMTILLQRTGDRQRPSGEVRALNAARPARITFAG